MSVTGLRLLISSGTFVRKQAVNTVLKKKSVNRMYEMEEVILGMAEHFMRKNYIKLTP